MSLDLTKRKDWSPAKALTRSMVAFAMITTAAVAAPPQNVPKAHNVEACHRLLSHYDWAPQETAYQNLLYPEKNRPRGLHELRNEIDKNGLTIFVMEVVPQSGRARKEMKRLYGEEPNSPIRVEFWSDYSSKPKSKTKGAVLHLSPEAYAANYLRGDMNPALGQGRIQSQFDNKFSEYLFASSIDEKAMGYSRQISQIERDNRVHASTQFKRKHLISRINRALREKAKFDRALIADLHHFYNTELEIISTLFPENAFLKYSFERATADGKSKITLLNPQPKATVDDFLIFLKEQQKLQYVVSNDITSRSWITRFRESEHNPISIFYALLTRPDEVFAQEALDVMKSKNGQPIEFRVDFIEGEAVRTESRFSYENHFDLEQKAMDAVNRFFAQAPSNQKHLMGGADVIFLKNGETRFIEFNIGARSGYINAGYDPIPAQMYLQALTGYQTQFLKELYHLLEVMLREGHIKPLNEYLKMTTRRAALGSLDKKRSVYDTGYDELFLFFQQETLRIYSQNPKSFDRERALRLLHKMYLKLGKENKSDLLKRAWTDAQVVLREM